MCFKMKMPAMPKVEQSARDILPSYESKDPESPKFGDGDDDSFVDIAKRKGKASLKIGKDDSSPSHLNKGYSSTNYNF